MIYTAGHSTLSEEDFLYELDGIDILIDTRSHPDSRWPQFQKENLEKWVPNAGIEYIWDPRLGGWNHQHAHLHSEFEDRSVDVAIYCNEAGKFPKQRIAKKWSSQKQHPMCPVHGCYGTSVATEMSLFPDDCQCAQLKKDKKLYLRFPYWDNIGLWDYSWFTTLPEFREGVESLEKMGESKNVCIFCCELTWWRCHRSMISDCLVHRGTEVQHLQPKLTSHKKVLGNRIDRYHPDIIATWDNWK